MDWLEIVFLITLLIAQAAFWYSSGVNRGRTEAMAQMANKMAELMEKL